MTDKYLHPMTGGAIFSRRKQRLDAIRRRKLIQQRELLEQARLQGQGAEVMPEVETPVSSGGWRNYLLPLAGLIAAGGAAYYNKDSLMPGTIEEIQYIPKN